MLRNILTAGLFAGLLAGLFNAALQLVTTVPLIVKAETYETSPPKIEKSAISQTGETVGLAHLIPVHDSAGAAPGQAAAGTASAWAPADGVERAAYTMLTTVGTGVGFALMLLAVMLASGAQIDARSATLWGIGGFIATGLAPGFGLPPELPGAAAADLLQRQLWWLATASASALGLWLIFQMRHLAATIAGVVLIVAPHIIGAPHPQSFTSAVPAELAGHFAASALAIHGVLWAMVGAFAGAFWQAFASHKTA